MKKKQHIEELKHHSETHTFNDPLFSSLQYAIDHLSREWVSRKTHRKAIKEQRDLANQDAIKYRDIALTRFNKINELSAEIDELKIDKDRLQSAWEKANKTNEMNLDEIKTLSNQLTHTKNGCGDEIVRLNVKIRALESDWEKEIDKVSKLQTQRIWLSVTTAALLITLLTSLFNR